MGRMATIALAIIAVISASLWAATEWFAPLSSETVAENAGIPAGETEETSDGDASSEPSDQPLVAPASAPSGSAAPGAGPPSPNTPAALSTLPSADETPAAADSPPREETSGQDADPAAVPTDPALRSVISGLAAGSGDGESGTSPATAEPEPSQTAGDPAAPPPAADKTSGSSPQSITERFRTRQVAYNRPPATAALGRAIDVSLVIDATGAGRATESLEGFSGEVVEREVALSETVLAQLTGTGFEIQSVSIARQNLSERIVNRWQWRIIPTEPGAHVLILELFGYAAGSLDAEPLDAYRDEIRVEVRPVDRWLGWASALQPVFGLIAGLAGAGSAGLAGVRFLRSRLPVRSA